MNLAEAHILKVMSDGLVRVAVMGNVDAGKSTLIGTLCNAQLDDGSGANRKLVNKFRHELESGRTSSTSTHLMAFGKDGKVIVAPRSAGRYTEAYLAANAHERTVSLMDVAGHEKYFKTTIDGLSRGMSDFALVLVNASQGMTYMTAHHLGLCQMLGIPTIALITKADQAPAEVLKHTRKLVSDAIRDHGKLRFAVRTEADIANVVGKTDSLVPVIEVSCVTGEGIDLLCQTLFRIPKRRNHGKKIDRSLEFLVEDQFNVPGVGHIVSGFVNTSKVKKGDSVYIGPLKDGTFVKTTVKSIHVAQTVVEEAWAGHSACFALSLNKKQKEILPRKGLVVLGEQRGNAPAKAFTAEIVLAKGDSVTMVKGQTQTTIHILHLKQACTLQDFEIVDGTSAKISADEKTVLRPGQRAKATFKFVGGPRHVRKGMRVVLRDGRVRGAGVIKEVHLST